jgi:hypothetical protein
MRPTRLLVAALVMLVAASGIVTVYRRVRADIETRARVGDDLAALYDDLLARHPELVPPQEAQDLLRFRGLDMLHKARAVATFRDDYLRAESRLVSAMSGPGGGERLPRYKTFTPNGFRDFANAAAFPHTLPLDTPPSITGHPGADERLRRFAMARGYRPRPAAPDGRLITDGRNSLQPEAMADWKRLREAAASRGIALEIVSAYRSPERQREMFMQRLRQVMILETGRELGPQEIAQGKADAEVDLLLRTAALPGFSRHQTGYAVDVADVTSGRPSTEFALTAAFAWLSADNYRAAKAFGFVPSYPEGAEQQGPDPEAWELVWVGENTLRAPAVPQF